MKARNLVLGLMLGANVLTAQGDVFTTAAITTANNASSSEKTIANAVSSTVINSQNTVIVECPLDYERVKKDGEWIGTVVPSFKKTVNDSECQLNKKRLEQLNNTHYKFGKVKGIFSVRANEHVMIELVQVNE